ncbi:MAG: hypothetical protein ACI976_000067 [Aureispira sp.]|jgi:hypothetical protein
MTETLTKQAEQKTSLIDGNLTISPTATSKKIISEGVTAELSTEINSMLSYAIYNGIILNDRLNSLLQNSNIDNLITAHNLLCENVSPATPKSIYHTKTLYQKGQEKSSIKKLPLVRNLLLLTIFFLLSFILTATTKEVSTASLAKGVFDNNGWPLFYNLSFLASTSALGVLFYLLKNISASVKNGTLEPKESVEYFAQVILGIVSGLFVSEILSVYMDTNTDVAFLNKSVLALLGGFSTDAIFSILQGLTDKLKALFTNSDSKK